MSRAVATLLLNIIWAIFAGSVSAACAQPPSAAAPASKSPATSFADPPETFRQSPEFTVISIKEDKASDVKPQFRFNPNGISARKYTPLWLMVAAYGLVEERRIINWPRWMLDDYYDVEAKVDESDAATFTKMRNADKTLLMQQFFTSRFNLKFHWESRDFKIFELVVAKGGPRLGPPRPITDEPFAHTIGRWHMNLEAVTMNEFCRNLLSTEAQSLVVDKTGLTGRYDFSLQWSRPDELVNGQPSEQPLIFTAIQEQLGLKMVQAALPTRVMVIDHIERPTEN